MKNYIIKFGTYSALFLVGIGLIQFYALGGASAGSETYSTGELLGYSTIILSMVFVIFGIKKYRDEERAGIISFGQSLKIGALIIIFPSMGFALYNIVYVKYMDPDFAAKYYEYSLDNALKDADPSEYEMIEAEIVSQKEFFANIPLQTVVMFLTVYIIGFIITVISSMVLSRKKSG
jgi:Protein of unknown function (DUF4199)